ncbi:hypothetical protein ACP70R_046346 [Stipagrostis hirtigluma subsp. patula]
MAVLPSSLGSPICLMEQPTPLSQSWPSSLPFVCQILVEDSVIFLLLVLYLVRVPLIWFLLLADNHWSVNMLIPHICRR